jgi:hypothetical protein
MPTTSTNGSVTNGTATSATYTLAEGSLVANAVTDTAIVSKNFTFNMLKAGLPLPVGTPNPFVDVGLNNNEVKIGSLNFHFSLASAFTSTDKVTFCYFPEGTPGTLAATSSITTLELLQGVLNSKVQMDNATGEGLYCTSLSGSGTMSVGQIYSLSIGRNDPISRFPRSYTFLYFRRVSSGTTFAELRTVDTKGDVLFGLLKVGLTQL